MTAKDEITVSVWCLCYNHEPYLRQCLDGFVMQQTSFRFEVVIHDDASTDGSAAIIREYEQKYPDIIKPIYQIENQYSRKVSIGRTFLMPATRGKYIAQCEGDDFWTDPLKLQKQVDFLEGNPEYSVCCTNTYRMIHKTGEKWCRHYKNRVITLNEIMYERSRIATLTVLLKHELVSEYLKLNVSFPRWPMGDLPMWMWMASKGNIYKLPDTTAVYRILEESASHMKDREKTFFFRLSSYEIRLFFCRLLKKCSLPIWVGREIFIIKYAIRNWSGHRGKMKYLFKVAWPIK